MSEWGLPVLALLLLVYAAVSARLRPTVVTQAMLFVALGLLVGNRLLDLVHVDVANQYVRLLAESTLTLVLFNDAIRIDLGALRRQSALPIRLLGLGLPLTIVAGTLAGLSLFPTLGLWTAAALATILAPTDAALGLPVVSDRRLPSRLRQGLNVESGLNDGVCVPLAIIFLSVAQAEEGLGEVHPLRVVLEEIGFGALGGVAAGVLGAWLLRTFAGKGWMDQTWQQILGVATPLLAYTVATALGGSGFIAAFVAGISFGALARDRARQSTVFGEQSGELLNAVTFLLFGAVLLGPALSALDWRVALYVALSLTVVRMLPVALALLGTRTRPVTVAFLGWFGPRGLASIVFVLILVEETALPERPLFVTVVTWTVAISVYAHGLTARPGADRYAAWYARRPDDGTTPTSEVTSATTHPLRGPATPENGRTASDPERRG